MKSQQKGKHLENTLEDFHDIGPDYKKIREQTLQQWLCSGYQFQKINRPLQAKYNVNVPLDCHTEFTQHFRAHAEISVLSAKNQDPNSKREKKKRNNKLAEKRESTL